MVWRATEFWGEKRQRRRRQNPHGAYIQRQLPCPAESLKGMRFSSDGCDMWQETWD